MTTPAAPPRRPVTTIRPRPQLPRIPYQGLFQEPAYEGGLTLTQLWDRLAPAGEDDDG
jgi:hypothetical protein